jgi:hypothetical protein
MDSFHLIRFRIHMKQFLQKLHKKSNWLKRAGILAFLFFLLKGLVWVGIMIWAWFGLSD